MSQISCAVGLLSSLTGQIGHPIVWWMSSLSLIVFVGLVAWYLMRFQRKINDFAPGEWERFLHIGKIAFGGWALHYRASLLCARADAGSAVLECAAPIAVELIVAVMGRVTYLHQCVRSSARV